MIWLLISVVLLIVLIFFRIDILLVAPIVSVFLCLVSGLDVHDQRNVCSCHAGHRYGGLDRSRHF